MARRGRGSSGDAIAASLTDRRTLKAWFPGLGEGNYRFTSPQDPSYNCVAWAMGDTRRFTWPTDLGGYFWPEHAARTETVQSFIDFFQGYDFELMSIIDPDLEFGFEKVAIYAHGWSVTHVARQIPETGWWTSKLASMWDIEHARPVNLEGDVYGVVVAMLRRATGLAA